MNPAQAPRRVILSSFGPFPGVTENPTRRVARHVAGLLEDSWGLHAEIIELQTRYDVAADALLSALDARRGAFDAVIALGVATLRHHVEIETIARNHRQTGSADAEGRVLRPEEALIEPGAPAWITAPVPVEATLNHLARRGLRVAPSANAGTYLCNELLYRLIRWGRRNAFDGPLGFIHIPPPQQEGDLDATVAAVAEIAALWARLGASVRR